MLKKLCVFLLVLLCLAPSVSFANDAASIIDKNENLSVSISLKNKEIQIGGMLDFTVTLTNNTSKPISEWYLFRVFSDTSVSKEVLDKLNCFSIDAIEPYETVVWDISEEVSSDVYWYEKDGYYYTDFEFLLDYFAYDKNEGYETAYYYKSKKTPIKLTNLYDGSEFLNTVSVESEDAVYLGTNYYSDYESSISKVCGNIKSDYSITNSSGFLLSNFTIRKDANEITKVDSLASQENIKGSFVYSYWMEKSEVSAALPLGLTTIFSINNKFYAAEHTKNMPAKVIDMPKLELAFNPVVDNPDKLTLSVKNISGVDYTNFYFDSNSSNTFSADKLIGSFEKNQVYEETFTIEDEYFIVTYGFLLDEKIFTWNLYYSKYYNSPLENIDRISFNQPKAFVNGEFVEGTPKPSPTPLPSPSPEPSPSQTQTATPSPSPKVTAKPTASPSPAPTAVTTPSPTPAVTVNSVTKKPAVPPWVWIVLVCALFVTGLVSILLYIQRTKE